MVSGNSPACRSMGSVPGRSARRRAVDTGADRAQSPLGPAVMPTSPTVTGSAQCPQRSTGENSSPHVAWRIAGSCPACASTRVRSHSQTARSTGQSDLLRGVVRYSAVSSPSSASIRRRLLSTEWEIDSRAVKWLYRCAPMIACCRISRVHSSPSKPSMRPMALVSPAANAVADRGSAATATVATGRRQRPPCRSRSTGATMSRPPRWSAYRWKSVRAVAVCRPARR